MKGMRITKHDGTCGGLAVTLCGDSCDAYYIFIYGYKGVAWVGKVLYYGYLDSVKYKQWAGKY